jgi:hypothetical protein
MPPHRTAAAAISAALLLALCAILSPPSSYSPFLSLRMWQRGLTPPGLSPIQKHFISSAVPPDMRNLINSTADPCSSMYATSRHFPHARSLYH